MSQEKYQLFHRVVAALNRQLQKQVFQMENYKNNFSGVKCWSAAHLASLTLSIRPSSACKRLGTAAAAVSDELQTQDKHFTQIHTLQLEHVYHAARSLVSS